MKINYQAILETIIEQNLKSGRTPQLLLHSCCAPCSSYVLEYLTKYFEVTVYYYNPNIYPDTEYTKRVVEQRKFIEEKTFPYPVTFIEGDFDKERFYEMAAPMHMLPEGSERCVGCYTLRLEETARLAKELEYDYFSTTLSISPMKNASVLNEIGQKLQEAYEVPYLFSDFKKKEGYKRSIELSKEYGLYRQDYCGCVYSYEQRNCMKSS
ncbi:MAG: epoxyqueuosine reductase QueH [Lachnospiraceae bacterium]